MRATDEGTLRASKRSAAGLAALLLASACAGRTTEARGSSYDAGVDVASDVGLEPADTAVVDPDTAMYLGVPSCKPDAFGVPGLFGLGAGPNCGSTHLEDCCESSRFSAGSFLRFYDGVHHLDRGYPAQLRAVGLDRYEITVGRFRHFVNAFGTWKPKTGDGAHPKVAGSGWQPGWPLPIDSKGLSQALGDAAGCAGGTPMWTDFPSEHENQPINCVTWYELFAFCAWDQARLPTLAERMYAGVGGDEQKVYPWSFPADSETIDVDHAVYAPDPSRPIFGAPKDVGSRVYADGRWLHADLAGNVAELVLDAWETSAPLPCIDCAAVAFAGNEARVLIGGGYTSGASDLQNAGIARYDASQRSAAVGGRCARD